MIHAEDMFKAFQSHRDKAIVIVTGTAGRHWHDVSTDQKRDLSFQGAMGQTTSASLGFALSQPDEKVVLFDSEGALLMNLGMCSSNINPVGMTKPRCATLHSQVPSRTNSFKKWRPTPLHVSC